MELPARFRYLLFLGLAGLASVSCGDGLSQTEAGADAGATDAASHCPSVTIDRATLLGRAKEFSTQHGIETTIAFDGCPSNTRVTCDAVQPSSYGSIVAFLDQVDAELSRYPAGFFSAIHLDYFVFGARLALVNREQETLGGAVVPYGDHRSVLFISTLLTGYCYAPVNKRTVHHEIAHAIDIGFAGVSEGQWWTAMNPPGFVYGNVNPNATDGLDLTHPSEGLVTKYAGFDVAEDYAEVYTAMFIPDEAVALRGWLEQDRSLRAKFRSVLGALKTRWTPFAEAMPNYAAVP